MELSLIISRPRPSSLKWGKMIRHSIRPFEIDSSDESITSYINICLEKWRNQEGQGKIKILKTNIYYLKLKYIQKK